IVVDVVLVILFALTLGPLWLTPNANLLIPLWQLYMSPLLVISVLLMPTLFFLWVGWKEKVTLQMFLFAVRIGLAWEFIAAGIQKLIDTTFLASPGIIAAMAGAPSPWIQAFGSFLTGNYAGFLLLIAVGEVLVGFSMLLGAFTRLGSLGGILMLLTYMFTLGWLGSSTLYINHLGPLAFFIVGMFQAGRYLGLDQLWGMRFNESSSSVLRFLGWWT
ncbi:MAG: TQO small subunit DoxD, partial [Candidatus Thorarchaeota archaeon]